MSGTKTCTRCGERLPLDDFYFVSRKTGVRRGQCKPCMSEIKQAQKDPAWRPECAQCGRARDRAGSGRRLCHECFNAAYDTENRRDNGSHRRKLNPCRSCGAKRLRADHEPGTMLCPTCRSIPQSRRRRLAMYGLNPVEYLALLDAHGHACAICRRKPRGSLHVDHQHKDPMLIRGLLCATCNLLLGVARDRQEVLRAAADFLDAPSAQELFPGKVAAPEANRGYKPLTRKRM